MARRWRTPLASGLYLPHVAFRDTLHISPNGDLLQPVECGQARPRHTTTSSMSFSFFQCNTNKKTDTDERKRNFVPPLIGIGRLQQD